MSLLGKILAILNVLAAAAFVYLAVVDYAKRQHWTHAVLRHDLKLNGLPLGDEDRDLEGNPIAPKLDQATLNELFTGAGSPVKTQVEEVRRARQDLQNKIAGPNPIPISNPLDLKEKLELHTPTQKLAWALRPLAKTASQREELNRLMLAQQDDKAVADRLQNELNKEFDQAVNRDEALGKKEAAEKPDERRRAIARLLFRLAELELSVEKTESSKARDLIGSEAYKRALAVVGLEAAVRAVDDEARNLETLGETIRSAMGNDRALFAQQHARLLVTTLDAADDLRALQIELMREQEKVQGPGGLQDVVKARAAEVEKLKAELAARQKETRALLAQQAKLEQDLFRSQQQFRDAAGANHKLEEEVRSLEKGR